MKSIKSMKLVDLFESRATEATGLAVLNKANVESPEKVISYFAANDRSQNQKNIPFMAVLYAQGYEDLGNITDILNDYNELAVRNRIKPIQVVKGKLMIGDTIFDDYIRFSEFIHGEKNKYSQAPKSNSVKMDSEDVEAMDKPLWSGNGFDIYDGVDVGRCIKYTQGGLTGRRYDFCIGQPGNSNYQSYRDLKSSTFYFIIDKNRIKTNEDGSVDLSDPLHIVVFDVTDRGPELTDSNNRTGNISEFGTNPKGYVEYLESRGVPVSQVLNNKPKTEQEKYEQELLGSQNTDLQWFIKLPYEYKSKYIGRGHLLTDAQFDYLLS
jgi:hypothetical protein